MRERLKHKYALSEQGVNDMKWWNSKFKIANVYRRNGYFNIVDYYYNILPVQRNIPRNLCGKWSQKTYTGREIKKDSIIIFR